MTLRTLAAAACLSICAATTGSAAIVTVGGDVYDITTVTGTASDNLSLLNDQAWRFDYALAEAVAIAYANDPSNPDALFMYDLNPTAGTLNSSGFQTSNSGVTLLDFSETSVQTFAVGEVLTSPPPPAPAVVPVAGSNSIFTINGTNYEISTVTGTYSSYRDLLGNQIWYRNGDLAKRVADAYAYANDTATSCFFYPGAIFVRDENPTSFVVDGYATGCDRGIEYSTSTLLSTTQTYAYATPVSPVPLPAGGLLLLSAVGGAAALKRRKTRAA